MQEHYDPELGFYKLLYVVGAAVKIPRFLLLNVVIRTAEGHNLWEYH